MDDLAKEVIIKMETNMEKTKRPFNKYDIAIGLFYAVGIFIGIGIFFVGGLMTMSGTGWGASLFGGFCFGRLWAMIPKEDKDTPLQPSVRALIASQAMGRAG